MTPQTLTQFIERITDLLLAAVPVLVALSFLFFLWGVATFMLNTSDEGKRKEGKTRMIWGMVVLFVIVSLGGLLAVVENTFFNTSAYGRFSPSGSGLHAQPGEPLRNWDGTPVELSGSNARQGDSGVRFGSTQDSAARRFPYFCVLGRIGDCPLRPGS